MTRLFHDLPDALTNTGELALRLGFTLKDLGYRFPDFPLPPGQTPLAHLRELVARGVRARYGTGPLATRARRQVAHEIDVIGRLDLAGYFLIVWDIVEYCRANDILVQGRGSAANSAVCYALGITAVDPIGMELPFERFLSEARGEWPDIDLDLPSGARREAVIQHVYQRYGRLGAGMTANVITYRGRSAAREVGKALGLPRDMQDRLARFVPNWGYQDAADQLTKHLAEAGCDTRPPRIRHFAPLWMRIQDLPRHLGQHSGGMVNARGRSWARWSTPTFAGGAGGSPSPILTRPWSQSSGARLACRSSRNSSCGWRWWRRASPPPRPRSSGARSASSAASGSWPTWRRSSARAWRARVSTAPPPRRSCTRSPRSRSMVFPSRTRRASRCSPTRARISRSTTRRRSTRRSSTTSPWGSTTPRRSSRTLSATASASSPSTSPDPGGCALLNRVRTPGLSPARTPPEARARLH